MKSLIVGFVFSILLVLFAYPVLTHYFYQWNAYWNIEPMICPFCEKEIWKT